MPTSASDLLRAASAYAFDNDGTLVDTETLWLETYARLLAPYGITHRPDVQRSMMGLSPQACVEALQRAYPALPQGPEAAEALVEDRRRFFHAVRAERGITPLPGVTAFLASAKRAGKRLAMATSATREDISAQLAGLGWQGMFEVVVTADDITHHKPAPDAYLEAARQLGLEPGRCLAFEDAGNGLRSARAAGMPVVFVRDARFRMEAPVEPEATVGSFEELLGAI